MKSKISCFKGVIFKRDFRNLIGIAIVFFLYLYYKGPYSLRVALHVQGVDATRNYYWPKFTFLAGINTDFHVALVAFLAVVCSLIVFHYLYDKRAVQMMHALPVSRTQLFVTHYLDGLMTLLLPLLLNMGMVIAMLKNGELNKVAFAFYGELMIGAFLFYNMMTLLIMICGVAFLPPILFLIFNYLFVGLWMLVERIAQTMVFGFYRMVTVNGDGLMGKIFMFSPLRYMELGMGIVETGKKLKFVGASGSYWYLVVALAFLVLAFFAYRRRPVESWGDFLTKPWLKIFFSVGISGCVELIVFSCVLLFEEAKQIYLVMSRVNFLIVLITTFAGFYVVSMIVRKSIRGIFKKKSVWLPACIMAVALSASVLVVQKIADSSVSYIPKEAEIDNCDCSLDFMWGSAIEKQLTVAQVRTLHQEVLNHKDEICNSREDKYGISFVYMLKNGKVVRRYYSIPLNSRRVSDKNALEYSLNTIYDSFDRFHQEILTTKWESAALWKYSDEEGNKKEAELPVMELQEAVLADIADGALKPFYFQSSGEAEPLTGNNILSVCLKPMQDVNFQCGQMIGMQIEQAGAGDKAYTKLDLRINEQCSHVLKVLSEQGFSKEKLCEGMYIWGTDM